MVRYFFFRSVSRFVRADLMRVFLFLLAGLSLGLGEPLVRVANTSLQLPATEPQEEGYALENAFGSLSLNQPVAIRSMPGRSDLVFVVEKVGRVKRVDLSNNSESTFFDVRSVSTAGGSLLTSGEQGLLSMAFHPNFANNGYFFVFYSVSINGTRYQRIARFTANSAQGGFLNSTSTDNSSRLDLITQRDQAGNHNGGDMHFGPDGYLYISTGDEGGGGDTYDNGRFIDRDFHSAILRIDVDNRPGNLAPNPHSNGGGPISSAVNAGSYSVPADNPFVGVTSHRGRTFPPSSVRTEIWVTGLRNPWRMSLDDTTGRWFVADVGQGRREEINIVTGGEDCGWPEREGFLTYPGGQQTSDPFHSPIYDYDRNAGRSVTGGLVYRGSRFAELFGSYVFADYATGRVWALAEGANGWNSRQITSEGGISGFGQDPRNGDLLLCDLNGGRVLRLVRASQSIEAPATLSATGAFRNLQTLEPESGLYGYEVNHPFWSDGAEKRRWFSVPNLSDQMNFSADDVWTFPSGQVWVKHFDLQGRKIETRFTVKTDEGIYGLSYRWREDQTDADLVGSAGFRERLNIAVDGQSRSRDWIYPSRADCRTCHTAEAGYALSFDTPQLNRTSPSGLNQLSCLSDAGFFENAIEEPAGLNAMPAIDDHSSSVEARVRAYLAVNCAMCHRGDESTVPGLFDARWTTKTDAAGLINGLLTNDQGDVMNRVLVPGDTTHSTILGRLTGDLARMPPLASTVVDQEAVTLLTDWINGSLRSRESFQGWSQRTFGRLVDRDADEDADGVPNALEFLAGTNGGNAQSSYVTRISEGRFEFFKPANRRTVLEWSSDLTDWTPMVLEGPQVPAVGEDISVELPGGEQGFLRVRMDEL